MYKDSFFWFSQPSSFIGSFDKFLFWFFAGMVIIAVILRLVNYFKFHPVHKQVVRRLGRAFLTTGIIGLVWFAFRYENTPMLADRFWSAVITLILLVWLGYIGKYLLLEFSAEKKAFDREQINSKYIPGKK